MVLNKLGDDFPQAYAVVQMKGAGLSFVFSGFDGLSAFDFTSLFLRKTALAIRSGL